MQARTLAALAALGLVGLSPLPAAAQASALNLLNMEPIMPGETVFIEAYFRQQLLNTPAVVFNEPEPLDWTEFWDVSGVSIQFESMQDITFTLAHPNGPPLIAKPQWFADADNLHDASSIFELSFAQPGTYTVTLGTVWKTYLGYENTINYRERSCSFGECGPWGDEQTVLVSGGADRTYRDGPLTLQVQVVPEPATTALWLAGLGAVGALVQRRRRAAAAA